MSLLLSTYSNGEKCFLKLYCHLRPPWSSRYASQNLKNHLWFLILSLMFYIQFISKSLHVYLLNISHICPLLSILTVNTQIKTLSLLLSFFNSLLPFTFFPWNSQSNLKNNKSVHITTLVKTQHLFLIIFQIEFKFLFITFKVSVIWPLYVSLIISYFILLSTPCIIHTCIVLFLIILKVPRGKNPYLVSVCISQGTKPNV